MKRLKKEGNEIELGKMIGEGFNVRKLLKLNRMKLGSDLIPEQTNNNLNMTEKEIEEVDDFLDNMKGKKEEVLHQIETTDCNYFMDLSGLHTQLGETYADDCMRKNLLTQLDS